MSKNRIGDNNQIKNSNIAGGDINNTPSKDKRPFLNKFLIPVIVAVAGAIIAAIVIAVLKINNWF